MAEIDPEFQQLRAVAQEVLSELLAPPGDTGTVNGINLEAIRARAQARMDCHSPRWLQAAFQEIDRLGRWADLRQRQVQAVLDIHQPYQTGQESPYQPIDHPAGIICIECGVPFPCKTRKAVLQK